MKKHLHALKVSTLLRIAVLVCGFALPAMSGPFSPIKIVNGLAITQYEFDQRVTFMKLLRQPGDIEAQSMSALIDDRIKQSVALQYQFDLPPEDIRAGMDEFASQAQMNADQFIAAIGKGGVDQQTFRDFIKSSLIWREIVRGKLGPTVHISEAEIDRALAGSNALMANEVRLAEIVLPATGSGRGPALAKAHHLELELRAGADFAELARKNSSSPTAGRGGALDWMLLSQLKPDAAVAVRTLAPGQVSDPVVLDDSVVIYQMQEKKQESLPVPGVKIVDYAEFLIPDNANDIAKVRNTVDSCDDLYGLAAKLPPDRLVRQTVPVGQVPSDIAGTLMMLDPGESSVALTRSGWRVFLMLCRRGVSETEQPTRDEVRIQLVNQRLGAMSEIYLEELRTEATILDP
jgi:peptidyl-prolyl cis-trans isomerase SurA